jgi:hypothetical protein
LPEPSVRAESFLVVSALSIKVTEAFRMGNLEEDILPSIEIV